MPGEPAAAGLFETLAAHPGAIAAAVGTLAFVESLAIVGIVTPGIALLAAGAAAAGAAGTPLSWLLAAGWIGAVLGDGLSFVIGHRYGPALRERLRPGRVGAWIARGEHFFARHGITGVILGRFLGPLRPVVPVAAGTLRMDPALFFSVNLATALAWSPAYLLPGYLVGASLGQALAPPQDWPLVLALALAVLWGATRGVGAAWRSGDRDGALVHALRRRGPGGRWLGASLLSSGGSDTRLSLLLGSTAALAVTALLIAALGRPAAASWREFAAELGALIVRLW